MPIVLIVEKVMILAIYGYAIKMMVDFRKKDPVAKFEFDLLSRLEIAVVIGMALASLVSVINPKTYVFTAGLCLLTLLLAYFQSRRIILAGNRYVLLKGKTIALKNIKQLRTGMFTLKVALKDQEKELSIYVPLTSNRVLREQVEAKIKKK